MLQPHGPMGQDCHRLTFDFEITMRHGHRRLLVTIRDELGIAIAAVIDQGFLHPAEARSGISANIFETEGFDDVHHVIGTTTVRDQNLSLLGSAWRLLCRHRLWLDDRSRACQHSTPEEFPPFHLALCHAILREIRGPSDSEFHANDIRLQAVREQIPEADVAVVGGGNAALCAALAARESGASVMVFECAPVEYRGGNSRHTRNMRCMHDAPTGVLTDAYTEKEYWEDLQRVTGGNTSEQLARLIIRGSVEITLWMRRYGVRFQPSLEGTLHLGRTNAFFLGGGKALMNAYYSAALKLGIGVLYNAEVEELHICDGKFKSGKMLLNGQPAEFRAKTLVVASGGFEANLEWLEKVWGEAARNFIIRGTPYNKGKILKVLLDHGAEPVAIQSSVTRSQSTAGRPNLTEAL